MLLQRILASTQTRAFTHAITRCKKSPVAPSEVTLSRHHLTLSLNAKFPSTSFVITPQGRITKVSGQLYGIVSKFWLCTQVSYTFILIRPTPKHRDKIMHHHTIRSSSLLSSSPSRRIRVSINLSSRRNRKQSSNVWLLRV